MTKNNPPSYSINKKPNKRQHFMLLLMLVFILSGLISTGLTWTHPVWQIANQSSLSTSTEEPDNPILTSTPTPVVPGNANETTGVILVGAILVLIVLGGTLGTTRRKL